MENMSKWARKRLAWVGPKMPNEPYPVNPNPPSKQYKPTHGGYPTPKGQQ